MMQLRADSFTTKTQEIQIYVPGTEIDKDVDTVKVVIVSDVARPRSVSFPADYFRFDEGRNFSV